MNTQFDVFGIDFFFLFCGIWWSGSDVSKLIYIRKHAFKISSWSVRFAFFFFLGFIFALLFLFVFFLFFVPRFLRFCHAFSFCVCFFPKINFLKELEKKKIYILRFKNFFFFSPKPFKNFVLGKKH